MVGGGSVFDDTGTEELFYIDRVEGVALITELAMHDDFTLFREQGFDLAGSEHAQGMFHPLTRAGATKAHRDGFEDPHVFFME